MTRDEIYKLPAGVEMDALISVKIMGVDVKHNWHWRHTTKNYSTDISAAWEVVEKLKDAEKFRIWHLSEVIEEDEHFSFERLEIGWYVCFLDMAYKPEYAETAPLAICRAALIAIDEQ